MLAVRVFLFMLLPSAVLFTSAGRFDLPFFWAYAALLASAGLAMLLLVDRGLLRERIHPGPGGKDRHLRWAALPVLLAHWVIAGLDTGRLHFSDTVPTVLRLTGLAVLALSMALSLWSLRVNRFFSPVVRIQEERGHHLITSGPYAWVRHPGYLAGLLHAISAVTLGSWAAMLPMMLALLMLGRRIVIEDRFLHEHLDGYAAYATSVRYRLLPGVW